MGYFRIARRFEIEAGHRLHKHPGKCRFPHGHTRVVEVVLRAPSLDASDMVCDYKALKQVVVRALERFDHAMLLASDDPLREAFAPFVERVVLMEEGDPTTEVIARHLFGVISGEFRPGAEVQGDDGALYRVPEGVTVERVRVWETPHTWAEYVAEP
ncbi:MAG TPA: 6-carboxytetrahydropterin synthase [Thermoanaerobaculaceae bacterium]|nr:6-carboxytetrahydropterin synthase [Thermoanaerobaculaceae bacterium]HRS16031.1 6-carboxytetrahydropterin synthase [Thermoanaerobaculaceae bacterium]